jgi:hypothetical protein
VDHERERKSHYSKMGNTFKVSNTLTNSRTRNTIGGGPGAIAPGKRSTSEMSLVKKANSPLPAEDLQFQVNKLLQAHDSLQRISMPRPAAGPAGSGTL